MDQLDLLATTVRSCKWLMIRIPNKLEGDLLMPRDLLGGCNMIQQLVVS